MGYALLKSASPFVLHVRCVNCLREKTQYLEVPEGDEAPQDADDLAECAYLQRVPFHCAQCDGNIGQLFAISGGVRS